MITSVSYTHLDVYKRQDKRCETAIRRMQQMGENKVIELCGSPIIVAQGAKMYWWKMNHPEVFARVKKFVPASTYVDVYKRQNEHNVKPQGH